MALLRRGQGVNEPVGVLDMFRISGKANSGTELQPAEFQGSCGRGIPGLQHTTCRDGVLSGTARRWKTTPSLAGPSKDSARVLEGGAAVAEAPRNLR